ncbi:hypothetical protein ASG73_08230 [Janibacter sp. Soil728]|uniref:DUF4153 domain-containing protein n=1 Tax=Janibacter sp. Soil728 TaxID=1736393 RepID=UPI0006F52C44|nr:DUF4153 domain-containing protein [Janibacter sp. Soil728]KRE37635.1 hypothetical protein ASG73_08230 [Janibacter sp. Soil728]
MNRSQPLSGLSSIRTRLAVLVGASVLVAAVVGTIGTDAGVPLWLGLPATVGVALVVTRWLASGMTTPLLQMTDAAQRMAKGDYAAVITTSGQDEVGVLARAFTSMATELEQSEEHRRRLVATVAHELRTPLSAQQALLENLADGVTPPDESTLRAALAQSERLASLVTDLLDLSRPDGRGVPFSPSRVHVQYLLDNAVDEAALQGRDVSLVVDVEPADLTVTGDPARLAQVTANLLDNAVRHSPSGGTVTMTARTDAHQWTLTVADDGPGLSPERAERLFHRFGPGGDEGGGTGLGLAIAAWVVTMHSGTIQAVPFETLAGQAPGPEEARQRRLEGQGAGESGGAVIRMTLPLTPPRPSPSPAPLAADRPVPTPTQETTVSVQPAPTTPPLRDGAGAPADPEERVRAAGERLEGQGAVATSPPSLSWSRWWPERTTAPQPRLVLAALVVGLLAAIVLPDNDLGLGLLLVLVAGGACLWLASPRRSSRWSWLTAALALPLGLTTILTAHPGYIFLATVMAGVLAAVACTDAHRVSGMVASVAAWPASALRGLPLLDRTVRMLGQHGRTWAALRISAVSLVLLVVFGGLLASADAVLGSWASALVPDISDMFVFRAFTLVFFAGVMLAGLYLAINPPAVDELRSSRLTDRRIPVREWQIPLGVVIAVFVVFIAAQAAATIGGHDYVMRTAGVTYAESARQGFGQLTLATALVLLLIAGVRSWGRADTDRDRRTMRWMNAALCVLTLLVVASALRRMALYQDAFGYTTLRVNVDAFEVWLGIIVLGVLVSLFVGGRWLGRLALVSAAVLVAGLSLGNVNGFVADRNIALYEETGEIDSFYLSQLGDDAVPTIHESDLPAEVKACVLSRSTTQDEGSTWPEWNLARSRADDIRAGYSLRPGCGLSTSDRR